MKDFTLKNTSPIEEIVDTIKEHGICVIENDLENLEDIKEESHRFLTQFDNGEYQFGKASRAPINEIKDSYPNLYELFNKSFMYECSEKYLNREFNLNEWVFITHDYINNGELARNGFLHFDRLYCFKFFYYLTDVDKSSGPFSCIPGTHVKGKELRGKTYINESGYENFKNRILLDYPELGYSENDIIPITGKAGTLIIFDTDMFHLGGVTNGKERLIVRGHTKLK